MNRLSIDQLTIDDERSFRHVALYHDLKEALRRDKYSFRVLGSARWDRALLLNLTYWSPDDGGDILATRHVPADVVAHVAWHHVTATALGGRSVAALFLGEAIASAFDVYLVGTLLRRAPRSSFLATQVPAMAEAARAAGASKRAFRAMLEGIAAQPERAFADLRELLFDATTALFASRTPDDAALALAGFDHHRFAALLHHYELSNWVLYARAHGARRGDSKARAVDRALRRERDPLRWLVAEWLPR